MTIRKFFFVALVTCLVTLLLPLSVTAFTPTGGEVVEKSDSQVASQWQPATAGRSDSIWKAYVHSATEVEWSVFLREFVGHNRAKFPERFTKEADFHLRVGEVYLVPVGESVVPAPLTAEQQRLLDTVHESVEGLIATTFADMGLTPEALVELREQLGETLTRAEAEAVVEAALAEANVSQVAQQAAREAVSERFAAFERLMLGSIAEVWTAIEELRTEVRKISTELANKVDMVEFEDLLARIDAGEVISQAQFDTMLQQFLAEQDLANFFEEFAVQEAAQAAFEERLSTLEAKQGQLADRVTAVEAGRGSISSTVVSTMLFALLLVFALVAWFVYRPLRELRGKVENKATGLAAAHRGVEDVKASTEQGFKRATRALQEARVATNLGLPDDWQLLGDLPTSERLRLLKDGESVSLRFLHETKGEQRVVFTMAKGSLQGPDGNMVDGLRVAGISGLVKPIAVNVNNMIGKVRKGINSNKFVGVDADGKTRQPAKAA